MKIRTEQIEAFELAARERFIAETALRLDEEYPDRFGRVGDKEGFVRDGIRAAERHGFSGRSELLRYIRLTVRVAPDLDARRPYDGYLAQLTWRGSDNTIQCMERAANGNSPI